MKFRIDNGNHPHIEISGNDNLQEIAALLDSEIGDKSAVGAQLANVEAAHSRGEENNFFLYGKDCGRLIMSLFADVHRQAEDPQKAARAIQIIKELELVPVITLPVELEDARIAGSGNDQNGAEPTAAQAENKRAIPALARVAAAAATFPVRS